MTDRALRTTATVIDDPAGGFPVGVPCQVLGYETPGTMRAAPNVTTGAILLLAGR